MNDIAGLSVLVLVAVLGSGRLLPLPIVYHPLSFFALFCTALAKKVHPDPSRPVMQQRISGGLALTLAVALPSVLLAGVYLMASWSLVIDAIVLLCCCDWQPYKEQAKRITASLDKSLNGLAKTQAKLVLLRDTKPLSELGLVKGLLESMATRFSQQVIAVVFWYLLAGAFGVLAYRLCQIASQRWSVKQAHYRHFGYAAAQLHLLLCTVPYGISALLLWLQAPRHSPAPVISEQSTVLPLCKRVLLKQLSRTLHVSIGGPAYYQQQRYRRPRLQQKYEPVTADISRLSKLQQHQFILVIMFLLGLTAVLLIR